MHLTPADVKQRCRVPLVETTGRDEYSLCTEDYAVIYTWRGERLGRVTVNASYPTPFLGVDTGEPEEALLRAGYRARIRSADRETIFGIDSLPDHSVRVTRIKGRLIEVCYFPENIEAVVERYRGFAAGSAVELGITVEFVPDGLRDLPCIDDSLPVQSRARAAGRTSTHCPAKAFHVRLRPLSPAHRVLRYVIRCAICDTQSDSLAVRLPSEEGTLILGECNFRCGCEHMFRTKVYGLPSSCEQLAVLLVAELFASPRDVGVSLRNVVGMELRVESLGVA
jgi:hypothetical protein